jgi:cytidyltransferase-like protein
MTNIATNGCFDLFHAGHKRLIEKCLLFSSGGKITIFLNSDYSVSKLKPGRPINNITKRIEDINKCINSWCCRHMEYPKTEIIVYDTEEELEENYNKLRPDIIVKGNDYNDVDKVVGRKVASILILPLPENEEERVRSSDLLK